MEFQRIQNAIELFGPPPPVPPPAEPPAEAPRDLPGQLEPKLAIAWGDFHGGLASSLGVLLRGPFAAKDSLKGHFFSGSWVEGRVPMRAVVAAALWHLAFVVVPFPQFSGPHKNPLFENTELVWSGPIEDFPLLEIPRQKAKPAARRPPAQVGACALPGGADRQAGQDGACLLYTSPSPRDLSTSRMPSSA